MSTANEWRDEIPVDFESAWYQSVLDRDADQLPLDDEPELGVSWAHVEVREVQYLLGRHLRTKKVRIITNRPSGRS